MTLPGFRGDSARGKPLLELGPVGPWRGRVKVVPLELRRGGRFEVYVEWHGPPAAGFPPDPRPGDRSDVYVTGDVALAKAIAGIVELALRKPAVPDLRAAAEQVRARLASGPYG